MNAEDIATILMEGFVTKMVEDRIRYNDDTRISSWVCLPNPSDRLYGVWGAINYENGKVIVNSIDWNPKLNILKEDVAFYVNAKIVQKCSGTYYSNPDIVEELIEKLERETLQCE